MALWLKKLSNLCLSALELACSELQHRGCKPLQADSCKTSHFTRADYARGILAWVGLLFVSPSNMYYHVLTTMPIA